MTIRTVFIQAHDVARSADFYANHLGGVVVSQTAERAVLDFVTASLDIRHLASGVPSAWQEDDINRGYRHIVSRSLLYMTSPRVSGLSMSLSALSLFFPR
jgi:hypothetical protein